MGNVDAIHTLPLSSTPMADLVCQKCGRRNPTWFTSNDVWNYVMGENGPGIFCPPCFIELAEAAGLEPTGWLLTPEDLGKPDQFRCPECRRILQPRRARPWKPARIPFHYAEGRDAGGTAGCPGTGVVITDG